MFIDTPDLIKALEQDGAGVHADVFKRGNAAYPCTGQALGQMNTGNTLEVRLCKSLDGRDFLRQRSDALPTRRKRPSSANGGGHDFGGVRKPF